MLLPVRPLWSSHTVLWLPSVQCGVGLITFIEGTVEAKDCLVPLGWGLVSMDPLAAVMCTNNTYGISDEREVSITSRCTQ
jgi:hypothetical protein